jgi:hypothetical protein
VVKVSYPLKLEARIVPGFHWLLPAGNFSILWMGFHRSVMEGDVGPKTKEKAPGEKRRDLTSHT